MDYQLAQLNVARFAFEPESPEAAGFFDNLDRLNALAEASPGFVWRLQTDEGNATSIRPFDDPWILVNLSVWEDVAHLKEYVYRTAHTEIMRRRLEWFEKPEDRHLVLWWVLAGHEPSVDEAKRRLELIQTGGPTPEAFDFRDTFPAP